MSRFIFALIFLLAPGLASGWAASKKTATSGAVRKDPVEEEYEKLLEEDDTAHEQIDKWIRDAQAFARAGAANPSSTLALEIQQKHDALRKSYENFLRRHPKHARARIAYGSLLNDAGDEEGSVTQWEKARELDPTIPAAWNNLANYYAHRSPVKKAFAYYAKAIELSPAESVYHFNLATVVYMFRKDAMEYFHMTENQVFDKALELYRQTVRLDPTNFVFATDYAESFYGTKPPRLEDGLVAWESALQIARDEVERQGVYVHMGRIKINLGRYNEARVHLNAVTNEMYGTLKTNLLKKLNREMAETKTNAALLSLPAKPSGPAP